MLWSQGLGMVYQISVSLSNGSSGSETGVPLLDLVSQESATHSALNSFRNFQKSYNSSAPASYPEKLSDRLSLLDKYPRRKTCSTTKSHQLKLPSPL
jgi:hypothetical protein